MVGDRVGGGRLTPRALGGTAKFFIQMNKQQIYAPLQPPAPTPNDELCSCCADTPVKLMSTLGYNPIHCVNCNLEVPLERLPLLENVAKALAYWQNLHDAVYRLWLDSEDYEEWARQQLSNIHSRINKLGLDAQHALNAIHRCYYWYFQDESATGYTPFVTCPLCGQHLQDYSGGVFKQRICETCGIIGAGE
jgi:hypothetical protein